jgi:hypothetical protein
MSGELRLLIQREPRIKSFAQSCKAAFTRVPKSQAASVEMGTPLRGPLISIAVHFGVGFGILSLWPYIPTSPQLLIEDPAEIANRSIVYVADRLPEVQDSGATERGNSGQSGIASSKTPQAVRVYRGTKPRDVVVDTPKLKLVHKIARVSNVVAMNMPEIAPPNVRAKSPSISLPDLNRALPTAPPPPLVVRAGRMHPVEENAPVVAINPKPVELTTKPKLPVLRPDAAPEHAEIGSNAIPLPPEPIPEKVDRRVTASAGNANARPDVVISKDPGDVVAIPPGDKGKLASLVVGTPVGVAAPSGDSGTGPGSRPDSGRSGPGAAEHGSGPGAIGAAGNGAGGAIPGAGKGVHPRTGIAISNGTIHLPSFGSNDTASSGGPGRPPTGEAPNIVVVASSRSGGGLSSQLAPRGGRVYTIYLATHLGTAVLQYADPTTVQNFAADLTAPRPIKTDVPADATPARAIISCVMDRLGLLRDIKLLEGDDPQFSHELLFALASWRFRPVFRGDSPVEVKTVIGFGAKNQ